MIMEAAVPLSTATVPSLGMQAMEAITLLRPPHLVDHVAARQESESDMFSVL